MIIAAFDSTNGYLYVTNSGSNNVSIINGATNKVVGGITVGAYPLGVNFDSLNGYVYVADRNSYEISVINGATDKVVDNITSIAYPLYLTFDSLNGYMYVTNSCPRISVINVSTNKVAYNITFYTSASGITFDSKNGNVYVVHYYSNTISIISPIYPAKSHFSPVISKTDLYMIIGVAAAIITVGVVVSRMIRRKK